MARRNDREHGAGGVLRVVLGVDPTGLSLTAQEGFLLSRIDGQTDWNLLLEMTGMDIRTAHRCLDDWLANGIVEWLPSPDEPEARAGRDPELVSGTRREMESPWIDSDPYTQASLQRRVLEFEARLGGSYHEQLGVEPGADDRAVKKAYFELSRQFHPDRFFRCDLGPYAERVSLIFKTIQEAYKALSTSSVPGPAGDCEIDDLQCETENLPQADAFRYRKLERLSQREMHNLPRSVRAGRRQKAREFMESARISEQEGRIVEALNSVRMAIRFEPGNVEYRLQLANLKARAETVQEGDTAARADRSDSPRAARRENCHREGPTRG
jgi:hypothetical protein